MTGVAGNGGGSVSCISASVSVSHSSEQYFSVRPIVTSSLHIAMNVKALPSSSGQVRGTVGLVMIQVGGPNLGRGAFGMAPDPFLAVVTFGGTFGRAGGKLSILSEDPALS